MSNVLKSAGEWLGFPGLGGSNSVPSAPVAPAAARTNQAARVSSLRPVRRNATDISEILTFQPKTYAEAGIIASEFRQGIPVIINMADLSALDQRNMLHYILGLRDGLEGHLKRVTQTVFLLSPASVGVGEEEDDVVEMAPADDYDIRRP